MTPDADWASVREQRSSSNTRVPSRRGRWRSPRWARIPAGGPSRLPLENNHFRYVSSHFAQLAGYPPTEAPRGGNHPPGGRIPDPQRLPPEAPASLPAAQRPPLGRPAASFPATQGLLLGHRESLGISQEPPSLPAPAPTGALWKPKTAIGDSFPWRLRFRPVSQASYRGNDMFGSVSGHLAQLAWSALRKPKPAVGDSFPWIPLAATRVARAS